MMTVSMLSKSTAIALFFLSMQTSIGFFHIIKTQLKAQFLFALQNEKATIVYFQIFGVSILYIIFIVGFVYSAAGVLKQKKYGRRLGMVLTFLNLILLLVAFYSRWEAGVLDVINFAISAFIIFSITMLSTSKLKA